MQRQQTSMLQ